MENTWVYQGKDPIKIKKFLQSLGMGHRLFNDIKKGAGEFLVDGRTVRSTTKILPNQPLTIKVTPEISDPTVQVSSQPVDVVFENKNWLVINKPSGISSVPGPTQENDTVLNMVKGYLIQRGVEDQRPHLITRLDRFTTGIMLIAKNRVASSMISQQVEQHTMTKEYVGVVSGQLVSKEGIINKPIARVKGQAARVIRDEGQPAKTGYQLVQQYNGYALVRFHLYSGRTHQIRVHMASIGHPLIGDHLYGGNTSQFAHQLLEADRLAFTDPFTLKKVQLKIPLGKEINKALQKLVHGS